MATLIVGIKVTRAWQPWTDDQKELLIQAAQHAIDSGQDALPAIDFNITPNEDDEVDQDDATMRRVFARLDQGDRNLAYQQKLLDEAQKVRTRYPVGGVAHAVRPPAGDPTAGPSTQGTRPWLSLGPVDARTEYNGTYYFAKDVGRPNAIRVDPTDPNTVYVAFSTGGVWKATTFHAQLPNWTAIGDGLGTLAIGALDIDPQNHLTIYIGTGDSFDQAGGSILKSVDGGATWGTPVAVTAITQGVPVAASAVRQIMVDPTNSLSVWATTNVGLFHSADAGGTWGYVPLPNLATYNNVLADDLETTWDIVYLGGTSFAVSGVYACPGFFPPGAGGGAATCASSPAPAPAGNIGDIWTTGDAGVTWQSARVGARISGIPAAELGRIALGAALPVGAFANAVIYAEVGNRNEAASSTSAILRSLDGGATFQTIATSATTVSNPTLLGSDCRNMNVGHAQSWYNLAVGVDPTNPDHVLFGGNLCGIRSLNGTSATPVWANTAHWLPSGGGSQTNDGGGNSFGALPYVHADWHTITVSNVGGKFNVIAGTDGGVFRSYDVFANTPANTVNWQFPDIGITTHLVYNHGTGDPNYGNANILFMGLQDNGTRWRLSETDNDFDLFVQTWDQVVGGDGIGSVVTNDPLGQNRTYWASVAGGKRFCKPGNPYHDCRYATRIVDDHEFGNWRSAAFTLPAGDSEPFFEKYSPINDAQSSVLTASTLNAWKMSATADDTVVVTRLSPAGFTGRSVRGQGVFASPFTYTIGGRQARVYGACLSGGFFATIVDDGTGVFAPVLSVALMGTGTGQTLTSTNSIAFPRNPANLGGTSITSTYIVSSIAPSDTAGAPILDATGRIFKTIDNGATWVAIHGTGLPNVAIDVVKFDYSDPSDQTIYAGTDLGLYRTTDGGATWALYGLGLPLVRVDDVSVSLNGSLVRASTYGRGAWEIYPHSEASAAAGNGDWDGNGVIDFFDLNAVASRWGTSPATTTRPMYDSTLDLDLGTGNLIDDTDLNTVISKFGGAP